MKSHLHHPRRAASMVATSIFCIVIIAWNARFASAPPAARASVSARGVICHDRPQRSYRPNETFYLSAEQRAHLAQVGKPNFASQAAGTYAKQILNRLLIDLSWNSSRLEGNTYSLLDTKRLREERARS